MIPSKLGQDFPNFKSVFWKSLKINLDTTRKNTGFQSVNPPSTGGKKHENMNSIKKTFQCNYEQMKNHKSNQKKINLNIDLNTQIQWSSYSII